jgi:hypothetical protein
MSCVRVLLLVAMALGASADSEQAAPPDSRDAAVLMAVLEHNVRPEVNRRRSGAEAGDPPVIIYEANNCVSVVSASAKPAFTDDPNQLSPQKPSGYATMYYPATPDVSEAGVVSCVRGRTFLRSTSCSGRSGWHESLERLCRRAASCSTVRT